MIRVMIVDDSALVRRIATDILAADPEILVVATAAQGEFALAKLAKERPDVITLDLEMPGIGGLETLRRIMASRPTPVIVLSAHAKQGAERTLQALELGAVDFVLKPSGSLSGGVNAVAAELVEKVKSAAIGARVAQEQRTLEVLPSTQSPPQPVPTPPRGRSGGGSIDVVAIGTSTGGPVALKTLLTRLPASLPVGVLVVQHMPPVFTRAFAERLDSCCELRVREAEDGDSVEPGRVLLAPGNFHMTISMTGGLPHVRLGHDDAVNGHRPSVDVLMRSVATEYGARAIGVIMTGMGKDGLAGLALVHANGGYIIAQDGPSSVIYGMNREVVRAGIADEVVPLDQIASRIVDLLVNGVEERADRALFPGAGGTAGRERMRR